MNKSKRTRLTKAGWKLGSAQDFLGLSEEEAALVEMKLALAIGLKKRRRLNNWTQTELAKQIGSSQSRVAKMESADASVSIDFMVRCLLALGASREDVGRILMSKSKPSAA